MIGKVVIGKTFGGCVSYVVQKKDAEILYGEGIRTENKDTMIHDFNMQRKVKPTLGRAVGHISLNWSIHDKANLTPEVMLSVAQEYLIKMKIKDTQVLIVQHKDKSHPHLHIIYNRVDNQGKVVSDHYQYKRNLVACKELTLEQGFHLSKGKTTVNREQLKGADKVKYQLYDIIKSAKLTSQSWGQFESAIASHNITIQFKYKGKTDQVQGISFRLGNHTFKGSEVDRSFSFGMLNAVFNQDQKISPIDLPAEILEGKQTGENFTALINRKEDPLFEAYFIETFLNPPVITGDSEDPMTGKRKMNREKDRSTGMRR